MLKPRKKEGPGRPGHAYYPSLQTLLSHHAGAWPCLPKKPEELADFATPPPHRSETENKQAACVRRTSTTPTPKQKTKRKPPKPAEYTVQQYVESALLLSRTRKFDVRTWLLIASTSPLVVFVAPGFGRIATADYNASSTDANVHISNLGDAVNRMNPGEHFVPFARVSAALAQDYSLPPGHMEGAFMRRVAAVSCFAVNAATWGLRTNAAAAKGEGEGGRGGGGGGGGGSGGSSRTAVPPVSHFQFFACDWVVDETGQGHLLECNATPRMQQQHLSGGAVEGAEGTTEGQQHETMFWAEGLDLVETLHSTQPSPPHDAERTLSNTIRRRSRSMSGAFPSSAKEHGCDENCRTIAKARGRAAILTPGYKTVAGWTLAFNAAAASPPDPLGGDAINTGGKAVQPLCDGEKLRQQLYSTSTSK